MTLHCSRRLVRGYAKKAQSIVRMYLAKLTVQIRREHVNANHIQRVWRGKVGRQRRTQSCAKQELCNFLND